MSLKRSRKQMNRAFSQHVFTQNHWNHSLPSVWYYWNVFGRVVWGICSTKQGDNFSVSSAFPYKSLRKGVFFDAMPIHQFCMFLADSLHCSWKWLRASYCFQPPKCNLYMYRISQKTVLITSCNEYQLLRCCRRMT